MTESPIRIAVELEGIEPNDRLRAAIDELNAAAAELVEGSADVTGFSFLGGATGDQGNTVAGVWTDMRPEVKSWSWGCSQSVIHIQRP